MIYLVTGGARSGKSSFAENIYKDKLDVVYIATSKAVDKEMKDRVRLHKESRPKKWRTYEGNYDFKKALGVEEHYLLDCITGLTSNIMFDISKDIDYIDYEIQGEIENKVMLELKELVDEVERRGYNLVLVTNEVGNSIAPENHISRVFRDIQGRINQRIALLSDKVYLVCCGLAVEIK